MESNKLKDDLMNIEANEDLLARTRYAVAKKKMEVSKMDKKGSKSKFKVFVPILAVALCSVLILAGVFVVWPMLRQNTTMNLDATTVAATFANSQADVAEDDETIEATTKPAAAVTEGTEAAEEATETAAAPTKAPEQDDEDRDVDLEAEGVLNFSDYDDIIEVLDACIENSGNYYSYYGTDDFATEEGMTASTTAGGMKSDSAVPAGNGYSETNVQVAGVDEGDIVKTDGDFIYYLVNTTLYVIDVRDAEDMKVVATLANYQQDQSRYYSELYFDEDTKTLTVIGSVYSYYYYDYGVSEEGTRSDETVVSEYRPYEYVFVECYDASDPSDLALIKSFSQEGYYVSSRRVDDSLYLITSKYIYSYYSGITEDMLPYIAEGSGDDWEMVPAKNIYIANQQYADSFTVVSVIDTIDEDEEATSKAVLGSGNVVYSTEDTLYIAGTIWDDSIYADFSKFAEDSSAEEDKEATADDDVYKTRLISFSITDGELKPKAIGLINGTVLNQYSIDEYDGALRVATTSGMWSSETSNNIVALDEEDLSIISSLTHLAPGESIYSARFYGERIYLVTFEQIDPFFVIDASDPEDMKVLGELKIPGYSNYLHMISDDLVLAIGNETYSQGGGVRTAGLKISVFDVSDPENPKQVSKLIYGASYGYSEVQYNPKALMIDAERGFIGLPLSFDKPAGEFGNEYIDGYVLIGIDDEGTLEHLNLFNNYDANISYGVSRGVYIDDTLFLMGYSEIASFDLSDFEHIDTLNFEAAGIEDLDVDDDSDDDSDEDLGDDEDFA